MRYKHSRRWEALGEFSTVTQTLDFVSGLHNCLEFSQPLSCLYQAMQTQENVFYCLNISCFILLSCVVLNLNTASFDDNDHYCYHRHFISSTIIIIITFISVNFYFSFVSNSLAYITIPQNNGKMKIDRDKKFTTTYMCIFPAL